MLKNNSFVVSWFGPSFRGEVHSWRSKNFLRWKIFIWVFDATDPNYLFHFSIESFMIFRVKTIPQPITCSYATFCIHFLYNARKILRTLQYYLIRLFEKNHSASDILLVTKFLINYYMKFWICKNNMFKHR